MYSSYRYYGLGQRYVDSNTQINLSKIAYNCAEECMVFTISFLNLHQEDLSMKYYLDEITITTPDGYTETLSLHTQICYLLRFSDKEVNHRVYNNNFKKFYITPWCLKNNPFPGKQCCSKIKFTISAVDTDGKRETATWALDAMDADIQGAFGEEIDEYDDGYTTHDSATKIPSFDEYLCKCKMKENGYTISESADLSAEERQEILLTLIRYNMVSKIDVIHVLRDFIEARKNVPHYQKAIAKWKEDLSVVERTWY